MKHIMFYKTYMYSVPYITTMKLDFDLRKLQRSYFWNSLLLFICQTSQRIKLEGDFLSFYLLSQNTKKKERIMAMSNVIIEMGQEKAHKVAEGSRVVLDQTKRMAARKERKVQVNEKALFSMKF